MDHSKHGLSRILKISLVFALYISSFIGCVQCETAEAKTTPECYCLNRTMTELYSPVSSAYVMRHGSDKPVEVIVAEQRGVVKLVQEDGTVAILLDIQDHVVSTNEFGDERGLLSAMPSPHFKDDGKLYVAYTRVDDEQEYTYISEFTISGDKALSNSERYILRVFQPFSRGNGGPMFFGEDEYLYIAIGDGGAEDDILGNAQNKSSLHGSLLRLDVLGGQEFVDDETVRPYKIPDDNPFVDLDDAAPELYAYGFRNMWGCSQDFKARNGDGSIYCAETGTKFFDEINIIQKGQNHGWNLKEGSMCYHSEKCGILENDTLPIFEFQHTDHHALVGGYVYRGSKFEHRRSKYIFGDVVVGNLSSLYQNDQKDWVVEQWNVCDSKLCPIDAKDQPLQHILGFYQHPDGELSLLMVSGLKAQEPLGAMFTLVPPLNTASKGGISLYTMMSGLLIALVFKLVF